MAKNEIQSILNAVISCICVESDYIEYQDKVITHINNGYYTINVNEISESLYNYLKEWRNKNDNYGI